MPRAQESPANRILSFFRTASIDSAELVLGLARDAVRERKQKAETARAAQLRAQRSATQKAAAKKKKQPPAKPAASTAPASKPKAKKKKPAPAPATAADSQVDDFQEPV